MAQWIKAAGMWLNTSNDGKKYMVGYMGGLKVCLFKNEKKENDKDFDYHLMFCERPAKKTEATSTPTEHRDEDAPF